jgi:Tol biopolymer transport system component
MRVNTPRTLLAIVLLAAAGSWRLATHAQGVTEAERQLQKAILLEAVDGNLQAAIDQYKKIVAQSAGNRTVAARALLRLAGCYEKLGQSEAEKTYRQLINDYADQAAEVAVARNRLTVLGQAVSVRTAMATRRVWDDFPLDNTGMFFGSASPDGRQIAFIDWPTGKIAMHDLATGQAHFVTKTGGYSPEWGMYPIVSPDGKRVAYQWFLEDACDIRVAGLDGSVPRALHHGVGVGQWMQPADWSPDGRQILVISETKQVQLALLSAADGTLRTLKMLDDWPGRVSFSVDGRYIAYDLRSATGSRNRDIFLLAADGSGQIPLVDHPADDRLLGWAPDGRTLLFTSDRTGKQCLWGVTVLDGKAQGRAELLKPDFGPIHPLGFARDGSFYYGVRTGIRDAYTAELDLTSGKVVSPPTPVAERFVGGNLAPEWSLEGDFLAWVTNRGQGPNRLEADTLCIRSNATGEVREVSPKVSFLYRLRWYPGGRFLLVQAQRPAVGYYRVDTQSGEYTTVRPLLPDESVKQPLPSPDGRILYFTHGPVAGSANGTVQARDLDTGRERVVCQARDP